MKKVIVRIKLKSTKIKWMKREKTYTDIIVIMIYRRPSKNKDSL